MISVYPTDRGHHTHQIEIESKPVPELGGVSRLEGNWTPSFQGAEEGSEAPLEIYCVSRF